MESNLQEVMEVGQSEMVQSEGVVNFGWSKECVKVALLGSIIGNQQAFKARINDRKKIAAFMVEISRHRSDNEIQIPRDILTHMRAIWCEALWPAEWNKRPVKNHFKGTYMSSTAFLEQTHIKESGVLGKDPCDHIKRTIGSYSKIYAELVADSRFESMFPLLQTKASSGDEDECNIYVLGIIDRTDLKKPSQKTLRGVAGGLCITSGASSLPADVDSNIGGSGVAGGLCITSGASSLPADVDSVPANVDSNIGGSDVVAGGLCITSGASSLPADVDSDIGGSGVAAADVDLVPADVDSDIGDEDSVAFPGHEFTDYIETNHGGNLDSFISDLTTTISSRQLKLGSDHPSKVLKTLNAAAMQSYFISNTDTQQQIVLLKQPPLEKFWAMSPLFLLEGVIVNPSQFVRESTIDTLKSAILLPICVDRALHVTHPLLISMYRKQESLKTVRGHVLVVKECSGLNSLVLEPSRISISYFGLSPMITWTCTTTINLVALSKQLAAQANRKAIEDASRIHIESMQRVPTKLNKGNAAKKAAEQTQPSAGNRGNANAAKNAAEQTQHSAGNKENANAAKKAAEQTQPLAGKKGNANAAKKAAEQTQPSAVKKGNANAAKKAAAQTQPLAGKKGNANAAKKAVEQNLGASVETDNRHDDAETDDDGLGGANSLRRNGNDTDDDILGESNGDTDDDIPRSVSDTVMKTARPNAALYNTLKSVVSKRPPPVAGQGDSDKGLLGSIQGSGIAKLVEAINNDSPRFRTPGVIVDVGSGDGCLSLFLSTCFDGLLSLGIERQTTAHRAALLAQVSQYNSDEKLNRNMAERTLFVHADILDVFVPWYKYTSIIWWYALGWTADKSEPFIQCLISAIHSEECDVQYITTDQLLDSFSDDLEVLFGPHSCTMQGSGGHGSVSFRVYKVKRPASYIPSELSEMDTKFLHDRFSVISSQPDSMTVAVNSLLETVRDLEPCPRRPTTLTDTISKLRLENDALRKQVNAFSNNNVTLDNEKMYEKYQAWKMYFEPSIIPNESSMDTSSDDGDNLGDVNGGDMSILESRHRAIDDMNVTADLFDKALEDLLVDCLRWNNIESLTMEGDCRVAIDLINLFRIRSDLLREAAGIVDAQSKQECKKFYFPDVACYSDYVSKNLYDFQGKDIFSFESVILLIQNELDSRKWVFVEIQMSQQMICVYDYCSAIMTQYHVDVIENIKKLLMKVWMTTKSSKFRISCWTERYVPPRELVDDEHAYISMFATLNVIDLRLSGLITNSCNTLPSCLQDDFSVSIRKMYALALNQFRFSLPGDTEEFKTLLVDEFMSSGLADDEDSIGDGEDESSAFVAPILAAALEKLLPGGESRQMGRPIKNKCLTKSNVRHTTNICWLISILQGLFHSSPFIDMLVTNLGPFNEEDPEKPNTFLESVWCSAARSHQKRTQTETGSFDLVSLHSLLYRELKEKSQIEGSKLLQFVNGKKGRAGERITRHAFNQICSGFDCIINLMDTPALELFGLVLRTSSYCERCKQTVDISSKTEERLSTYALGVLEGTFEQSFYASIFSDCNNLFQCDHCLHRAARRSNYYEPCSSRRMLAISFGEVENKEKKLSRDPYPELIIQSHTIILPTSAQFKSFEMYQISSIINGIGGHYVIDVYNDDLTQVCKFNDDKVCCKRFATNDARVETPALIFATMVADSDISTESRKFIDKVNSYDAKDEYGLNEAPEPIVVSATVLSRSVVATRSPGASGMMNVLPTMPIVVTADTAPKPITAVVATGSALTKKHRIDPNSRAGQFLQQAQLQQIPLVTSNPVSGIEVIPDVPTSAAASGMTDRLTTEPITVVLSRPVVANTSSGASDMANVPLCRSLTSFLNPQANTVAAVSSLEGRRIANPTGATVSTRGHQLQNPLHTSRGTQVLARVDNRGQVPVHGAEKGLAVVPNAAVVAVRKRPLSSAVGPSTPTRAKRLLRLGHE